MFFQHIFPQNPNPAMDPTNQVDSMVYRMGHEVKMFFIPFICLVIFFLYFIPFLYAGKNSYAKLLYTWSFT